jgi:hypothetical protein
MNKVIEEVVPANRRFVLVNRGNSPLLPWVRRRLWSAGYLARSYGDFHDVHVTLFEKLRERYGKDDEACLAKSSERCRGGL